MAILANQDIFTVKGSYMSWQLSAKASIEETRMIVQWKNILINKNQNYLLPQYFVEEDCVKKISEWVVCVF